MKSRTFGLDQQTTDHMIRVRRHLHQHPELSHREFETSRLIETELRAAGVDRITRVGDTGLVVDIVGKGDADKTIAIRGDLDALPIQERTGLPFESTNAGVMHACGHDTHAAMALATGLHFHNRRDVFSGRIRLLFQHSEEDLPSGARQMVEAGCLEDVDSVLGIHVDPLLPSGTVAVRPATYACSSDHFDIEVRGVSCHGGKPHEGVDAIAIACAIVGEINRIRAHNTDPIIPLTITVGMIEGGTAHNIVSDRALLRGTIRAGDGDVREIAHRKIDQIARSMSDMYGGSASVSIKEDAPLLNNDPDMTELVRRSAVEVGGEACFIDAPMWTASDDFGYLSDARPGVYFRLGVGNDEKGFVHPLHHPEFAVDEAALPLGAAVLIRAVTNFLCA